MNKKPKTKCLICKKLLYGRIDKKFCDDRCRNHFHNNNDSVVRDTVRPIQSALRKNRRILAELINEKGETKILRDNLLKYGFDLRYYTHSHKTLNRSVFWCYDYGY